MIQSNQTEVNKKGKGKEGSKKNTNMNRSSSGKLAEGIWYFAYGSNMLSSTFRKGLRGTKALAQFRSEFRNGFSSTNTFGTPNRDPAFSSTAAAP